MKHLKIFLFFYLFLFSVPYVNSQVKLNCYAQYQYEIYHPEKPATYYQGSYIGNSMITQGKPGYYETKWSDLYQLEISFFSGEMLNEYYDTNRYNSDGIFAIVKWNNGGVSFISINNYTINSKEIIESSFQSGTILKGKDQDNRNWEIAIP